MRENPDPLATLLRRWADDRRAPARHPRPSPVARPVPWALLAAAAVGVIGVGLALQGDPAAPPDAAPAVAAAVVLPPASAPLEAPVGAGVSTPLDGVRLAADGTGVQRADAHGVRVDWSVGTLEVEVAPGRGLDVQVHTEEAAVRVVGTGFTVKRSALGTEVTVRHGVVEVTCTNSAPVSLYPGGSRLCLPTHAASFLGRARALEQAGAPAAEVRAAAERGLAGDLPPSVRGELEVVRIRTFLSEGDAAQGLAAAGAYLEAGYPDRRAEVLGVAADLAESAGACEDAARWRAELGQPPGGCPR